ncbi:serine protease inhibitor 42Dd-like isoform X2 [Zootermopsis nevadensis]|nr:serine protease inhibitor 42Dd-like isoform X2 [Zootermopsis nevadensis]
MVLEGARGKSAKELKEALRLPEDERAVWAHFSNFLNSLQVNNPSNRVEAANQIFFSHTITPQQQYEGILKKHYMTEIEKVDFTSPVYAAELINTWVNMHTHGQIPSLVDPGSLSANTKLMLVNALYFKGKWKYAFDFDKTSVKCFYVDVNQCLDSYFMESVKVYNYAYINNLHAHAVELPYEGNKFSLLLLLPNKPNTAHQLVRDLTHVSLHNIVSSLDATEILVSVPRFSIDYSTDLIHKLIELGIQDIFSTNANLTGMVQWGSHNFHISNIFHKAKIEINEEGTVAAAATGTLIVPLISMSLPKLIFNHPFLFFLRNTETGDVLFAGRMSQPEAARQPVVGSLSESELSELTQSIFTSKPATGAEVPVSNTNQASVPAGGTFNTNSKPPVPQIQPTIRNHYSYPNNVNNGNNFPSSASSQTYRSSLQPRSANNNPSQSNTAQYKPYGNSEIYHASNPDTVGVQYAHAPVQFSSVSGSYASSTNSAQYPSDVNKTPQTGVRNINQSYNDRIHFSP